MAPSTILMTVEEFQKLPEDDGPVDHELRHGELVAVSKPKAKHMKIQRRLFLLLEAAIGGRGAAAIELAFRALPEHELRSADVAYVSQERWENIDPDDNLRGAPDIAIEVLSPSNTVAAMLDKEELCLENGSKEFWLVDPIRRQVKVSTPDGHTTTYRAGQNIPLPLPGDATLAVDSIFS